MQVGCTAFPDAETLGLLVLVVRLFASTVLGLAALLHQQSQL